jgi:Secretion system C-terminal sorting domain
MPKSCVLLFLSLLSVSTAIAQRLKTEDFNYSPGQLTSLNAGANVSNGSWLSFSGTDKPLRVVAGNLIYPDYLTAPSEPGACISMDSSVLNAEDAFMSFPTVTENTVYISFLLKVDNTSNLVVHDSSSAEYLANFFSTNPNSAGVCRLYIRQGSLGKKGQTSESYNLGIAVKGYAITPINWIETDLLPDSIYLITMAYQVVPGANNDTAKLWINQAYASNEPPAHAMSAVTAEAGNESVNISRFALRQGYNTALKGGTPKCKIDAIKVSSTWSDATLPVRLLSISALNNNGHAKLNWETCNEVNVKNFEIERSADARNFSSIAMVAAKNGNCNNSYEYADTKSLSGTAYYRIKTVDNDGAQTYSAIVSIGGKPAVSINVFPNPAVNNMVISHPQAGANAFAQIIDMNGKMLLQQKLQEGAVQTSVDVAKLSRGHYTIVYSNASDKQSLHFIKR